MKGTKSGKIKKLNLPRIGSAEMESHSLIPQEMKERNKECDKYIKKKGILAQLKELENDLLLDGYMPRSRPKLVLYDTKGQIEEQQKIDIQKNLEVFQKMQNKR